MWNKITPPVLGLDTNLALAIAGGMVLVGLAMLLWGRKVHWAFVILAGAGAGVLFLTPVVQKCTGLELRPAQIMAGISAGLVAGFGAQFVWAFLAGATCILLAVIGALVYFHPSLPAQLESVLPKAGTPAEQWGLAMGNAIQIAVSEAWKKNWSLVLMITGIPGVLGIVLGIVRSKATIIVLTPLLGAALAVCGALVAAEAQKSSLWTSAWADPVIPGAIVGGLMLAGFVVQCMGAAKQARAAKAAQEKAQQQAAPTSGR